MKLTAAETAQLNALCKKFRIDVLTVLHEKQTGHPGGSLSVCEILTTLYFKEMNVRPDEPQWAERDRLVLSKGHAAPMLYRVLAEKGFFPVEEMHTLRDFETRLQGHPCARETPGVDASTGPLGMGLSAAVGMALAGKVAKKDYRVYAVLGDGEIAEGQVWEAAMSAAKYKLDNLCAVVDVNGLQIDGATKDVMPSEPLDKKFEAFNWNVIHVDGHDYDALVKAFAEAETVKGKPTALLLKTVKGKGVSFMENNAGWHGKAPNDEQYEQAKAEVEAKLAELEGK